MTQLTRDFYKYTSLSVLGMLGSAGTILADTFFVSDHLGANGLAALNIAICIFGLLNGLGLLLGIGGATFFSIVRARGEHQRADQIFSTAFAASAVLGGLMCLCGLFFSRPLVQALGAEGEILPMADVYMKTILCCAPFFLLRHLYVSFVRNDGNPRLAMAAMLAGSIANIVLDYLFIYPLEMGIFGAALATALTPLLGVGICLVHFLQKKNSFHLIRGSFRLSVLRQLCSFGSAAFVNEFSSGVVLLVFNLLILRYAGTTGVAAYGIVANLALVVMAVYTGLSQGVQPLLSRAYGLGRREEVRLVYRRSLRVCAVLGLLVTAGAIRFAPELVSLFNHEHNETLQAIAESGLVIYFLSFLFLGYNFMASSLFSATERAGSAFSLSFFRGCAGIILTAVLFARLWGLPGVWASVPAVEVMTAGLGLWLSRRTKAFRDSEEGQQVPLPCRETLAAEEA